jgi:histidinol phosphatase-like enzyme (inositol monophosphatase family)
MPATREFFTLLADAAASQTLPFFRQHGAVIDKGTGVGIKAYDPVTQADRAAEQALRALIKEKFPSHGILGEEFGGEGLNNKYVWVIDPIDGTRSFISGIPVWGTLVGLTDEGRAIAGFMSQPYTNELFWACNGKSYRCKEGVEIKNLVSNVTDLAQATLITTSPHLFNNRDRINYDIIERKVKLFRYSYDCYAYAMLAAGFVDLIIDTMLETYDIIALIPIIEAAGGVITDWKGDRAEQGGNIIAAASPQLHKAALEQMRFNL